MYAPYPENMMESVKKVLILSFVEVLTRTAPVG